MAKYARDEEDDPKQGAARNVHKIYKQLLEALPDDDDRKFLVTLLTSDPDDVSGGGASDSAATARRYLRPTSGLGAFPRPQEGRSLRLAEDEFKRCFPASEPAARRD